MSRSTASRVAIMDAFLSDDAPTSEPTTKDALSRSQRRWLTRRAERRAQLGPEDDRDIYVIGASEIYRVKIGSTSNPETRLASLQTGCPCNLELLMVFEGSHTDEREIHEVLSDYWVRGEWYRADDSLFRLLVKIRDVIVTGEIT